MTKPSTYEKGDIFEERVYKAIKELLDNNSFYVQGKNSKIFRKAKYYSKDREANITFDIAIETYLPEANKYSILTLIECKNYDVPVGVGDIEEFYYKATQVGAHKALFITATPFQKSAIKIAISKKMGIAQLNSLDNLEWISNRLDNNGIAGNIEIIEDRLSNINSNTHVFLAHNEGLNFTSLPDLLMSLGIIDFYQLSEKPITIPFLEVSQIEERINELSLGSCYQHFKLNTDRLCEAISTIYDVNFILDEPLLTGKQGLILGMIRYNPLTILVEKGLKANIHRWRFTLVHEIGHLVLHSALLHSYYHSTIDTDHMERSEYIFTNKYSERLEIQANLFASLLLLPTKSFITVVNRYFQQESISKGFIFWDSQPVNMTLALNLLSKIEDVFGVSKEMAKVRLKGLGLLKDNVSNSLDSLLRKFGYK